MLEDKDIQKIIEANREVFPNKEDFEYFKEEMKKSFSDLQTSVGCVRSESRCLLSGNGSAFT